MITIRFQNRTATLMGAATGTSRTDTSLKATLEWHVDFNQLCHLSQYYSRLRYRALQQGFDPALVHTLVDGKVIQINFPTMYLAPMLKYFQDTTHQNYHRIHIAIRNTLELWSPTDQEAWMREDFLNMKQHREKFQAVRIWDTTPCHVERITNLVAIIRHHKFVRLYLESEARWHPVSVQSYYEERDATLQSMIQSHIPWVIWTTDRKTADLLVIRRLRWVQQDHEVVPLLDGSEMQNMVVFHMEAPHDMIRECTPVIHTPTTFPRTPYGISHHHRGSWAPLDPVARLWNGKTTLRCLWRMQYLFTVINTMEYHPQRLNPNQDVAQAIQSVILQQGMAILAPRTVVPFRETIEGISSYHKSNIIDYLNEGVFPNPCDDDGEAYEVITSVGFSILEECRISGPCTQPILLVGSFPDIGNYYRTNPLYCLP